MMIIIMVELFKSLESSFYKLYTVGNVENPFNVSWRQAGTRMGLITISRKSKIVATSTMTINTIHSRIRVSDCSALPLEVTRESGCWIPHGFNGSKTTNICTISSAVDPQDSLICCTAARVFFTCKTNEPLGFSTDAGAVQALDKVVI
jgi:hypothetical protein